MNEIVILILILLVILYIMNNHFAMKLQVQIMT